MLALVLLARGRVDEARIRLLAEAVKRFEWVGATIADAVSSGVVNYLFIVGPRLDDVLLGTYGVLLAIKVLLFAGMLVLAALNRFHLGRRWQQSLRDGQHAIAANALRRSVLAGTGNGPTDRCAGGVARHVESGPGMTPDKAFHYTGPPSFPEARCS
jgi:putative copper resistance protein D